MEEQLRELLTNQQSLNRKLDAIVNALLNLKGFYIETADGSQQGLLVYGVPPKDPEPVSEAAV